DLCSNSEWLVERRVGDVLMNHRGEVVLHGCGADGISWRGAGIVARIQSAALSLQCRETFFEQCQLILPMAAEVRTAHAHHEIFGVKIPRRRHQLTPSVNGAALVGDGVVKSLTVPGPLEKAIAHRGGNSP